MSHPTDRPWALVVAGGGTGGHLFPAIAVREELNTIAGRDIPTHWLCSDRSVDARILSAQGQSFDALPAKPLIAQPKGLLRFAANWAPSVRASRATLRRLKAEHARVVVLSTGGFAAAPVVQAAQVERCPIHALVLDAPPGKATRWIVRHAVGVHDATLTGSAGVGAPVGPIVRRAAIAPATDTPERARSAGHWGLDPQRPVLLVTGGSLGAHSLNEFIGAFIKTRADEVRRLGWQVLHQAGGEQGESLEAVYREAGVDAKVVAMLDPMGPAWGASDLAVCRAGAGTVAEVALNGVVAAFMPYPHHRDRHQAHNAEPLVSAGGSVLWDDLRTAGDNLRAHAGALLTLLRDREARGSLSAAIQRFSAGLPAGGATRVARALREQMDT